MRVSEQRLTAASFEDLAMPLFDQLYNFAHWLTQDRAEAEDLVQETYAKGAARIFVISSGYQFSRMDVPHPAKFVSEFADGTEDHGCFGRRERRQSADGEGYARGSIHRTGQSRNRPTCIGRIAGAVPGDFAAL